MSAHALDAVLVMVLAACAVADVTRGRIPNAITFPAIVFGLTAAAFGPPGVRSAVEGLVAGAAAMYVACVLGATGGGNVKLMAAVGALKGLSFVVSALFFSVLAGGIWAALVLIWSGQAHGVFSDVGKWFERSDDQGTAVPPRGGALPFSLAIGVGTLTTLTLKWR